MARGRRNARSPRPAATDAAILPTFGGTAGVSRLSTAVTRSASAENFDASKGGGARSSEGTGAVPGCGARLPPAAAEVASANVARSPRRSARGTRRRYPDVCNRRVNVDEPAR